jgi:hypothetical protein
MGVTDFSRLPHPRLTRWVMSFLIIAGLLGQWAIWILLQGALPSVWHSIVTAMIATALFEIGGQYYAKNEIDWRQVVWIALTFGPLNGTLIYFTYAAVQDWSFLGRWIVSSLYSLGITVVYTLHLHILHYRIPRRMPSVDREAFAPAVFRTKLRQLLRGPGLIHIARQFVVQIIPGLSELTRAGVALTTGSMVAVLASYIANKRKGPVEIVIRGVAMYPGVDGESTWTASRDRHAEAFFTPAVWKPVLAVFAGLAVGAAVVAMDLRGIALVLTILGVLIGVFAWSWHNGDAVEERRMHVPAPITVHTSSRESLSKRGRWVKVAGVGAVLIVVWLVVEWFILGGSPTGWLAAFPIFLIKPDQRKEYIETLIEWLRDHTEMKWPAGQDFGAVEAQLDVVRFENELRIFVSGTDRWIQQHSVQFPLLAEMREYRKTTGISVLSSFGMMVVTFKEVAPLEETRIRIPVKIIKILQTNPLLLRKPGPGASYSRSYRRESWKKLQAFRVGLIQLMMRAQQELGYPLAADMGSEARKKPIGVEFEKSHLAGRVY